MNLVSLENVSKNYGFGPLFANVTLGLEERDKIGLIGATGRVTGPHLHWNARYGSVTVNPLDLLTSGRP